MESYYDSDEELAWGKPSLRELKKDLEKKQGKVAYRRTDFGHYPNTASSGEREMSEQEPEGKPDNSGTSAYFTPDDTLQTEPTSNKNEEFLEKLAKVVESEPFEEMNTVSASNLTDATHQTISKNVGKDKTPKQVTTASTSNRDFTGVPPTFQDSYRVESVDDTILKIIKSQGVTTDNLDEVDFSLVDDLPSLPSGFVKNPRFSLLKPYIDSSSSSDTSSSETSPDTSSDTPSDSPIHTIDLTDSKDDLNDEIDQNDGIDDQNDEIGDQNDEIGDQKDEIGDQNDEIRDENDEIGDKNDKKSSDQNDEIINSGIIDISSDDSVIEVMDNGNGYEEIKREKRSITPDDRKRKSESSKTSKHFFDSDSDSDAIDYQEFMRRKFSGKKSRNNKAYDSKEIPSSNQLKETVENKSQNSKTEEVLCTNNEGKENSTVAEISRKDERTKQRSKDERTKQKDSETTMQMISERVRFTDKLDISGVSRLSAKKQSLSEEPLFEDSDLKMNSLHSESGERSFENCSSADTDLQSRNVSLAFNDTMEEMEMALKQGLDYVMPDDATSSNETIEKLEPLVEFPKAGTKKKPQKTPMKKFDYIQSPIGDYIRKKSPKTRDFKIPLKPPKMTPKRPSPALQSKQLKSIVSPIGVYIKNSTGVRLKQNVPVKTVPKLFNTQSTPEVIKSGKENMDCGLPEAIYQPPRKTVTSTKKEITLPSSIKKLIKEPEIKKHEERIGQNLNQTAVCRKLLEEDLTATIEDSSLLNQTNEDVSFVTKKQAFIQ